MQRQPGKYLLAFRRSVTFRTINGETTFLSSAEIVPVELLQAIPATKTAPALYELSLTLDGECKVLIVKENTVELRKVKSQDLCSTVSSKHMCSRQREKRHG